MSTATQNGLVGMAARLTDPEDRAAYAAVLSYVDSLPETDELVQVVRLVGLVALLAQHIPDAMAEFLETFRAERKAAVEYHTLVSELMERLPEEITATVDPVAMGKALGENFRQQIANCGVSEAVQGLTRSLGEVEDGFGEADHRAKAAVGGIQPRGSDGGGRVREADGSRARTRTAERGGDHETSKGMDR